MGYLDQGFDEFLNRIPDNPLPKKLNPLEFDAFTDEIQGNKVSGILKSGDSKLIIDLLKPLFSYSDGVTPRVEIGQTKDGPGIIIYDGNGNIIFESTDTVGLGGTAITDASIDVGRINFTNFIRISDVFYLNDFSLGANTALTINAFLDKNNRGKIQLATPRWSFYDGAPVEANEVTAATNNIQEISNNMSWDATGGKNNNFRSMLKTSILNITGAPRIINFRVDWVYLGN